MAEQTKNDDGIGAMTTLTVAIICCGTLFALTHARPRMAAGASRSVRLQFEKRQQAMEAAAAGKPYELPADQKSLDEIND